MVARGVAAALGDTLRGSEGTSASGGLVVGAFLVRVFAVGADSLQVHAAAQADGGAGGHGEAA